MRAANQLFEGRFETLLPRIRTKTPEAAESALGKTERISYDWLANGGKRFRPFMTLAAYDALTGGKGLSAGPGRGDALSYSDGVGRVAMAIEAFHKASLVHDDIEDDDQYRYGQETLHRRYDLGTAINVGDHLIGLGYRLVSSARKEIGAEAAADILDRMSAAHVKLCDGQGAEMAWQSAPNAELTPLDALQIYALKTSPAFEAALYAGLRMAGPADAYEEFLPQFARQIGVGFQILNDLKDWRGDDNNKLIAGQDALSLRPTVLLALAYQSASESERQTLHRLVESQEPARERMEKLRAIFERHKVFDKAELLIEKSRARAEALVEDIEPEELRQLCHFLIDTVLASEDLPKPDLPPDPVLVPLQIGGAGIA
jgi:geranylgeranyl pyrophosphate synthase